MDRAAGCASDLDSRVDIREIRARTDAGVVGSDAVAAYIAKYATKAAEDFGLDSRIRTSRAAEHSGLRPHVVKMIATCEAPQGIEAFNGVGGWAHMLGFRGHFTTKSRSFSTTLTALREARRHWRAGAKGSRVGSLKALLPIGFSTDSATELPEIASSPKQLDSTPSNHEPWPASRRASTQKGHPMTTALNPPARMLLNTREVAERLGISRTKVYELMAGGTLRSVRIGRSRRVPLAALDEFIEELISHGEEDATQPW